jgi:hypothetical protein
VAAASASLPMVWSFAIGKAFGLTAATREYETLNRDRYQVFRSPITKTQSHALSGWCFLAAAADE